ASCAGNWCHPGCFCSRSGAIFLEGICLAVAHDAWQTASVFRSKIAFRSEGPWGGRLAHSALPGRRLSAAKACPKECPLGNLACLPAVDSDPLVLSCLVSM